MFKLKNTNRFFIKGTNKDLIHLATITRGIREFVLLVSLGHQRVYLNESTSGNLTKIDDDELFNDLQEFIDENGLSHVTIDKPLEEQPFFVTKEMLLA